MLRHHCLVIPALLLLLASAGLQAADEDTNLRLNQRIEGNASVKEQQLLEGELDEQPSITLNGETLTIGNNANDLGRALYLSLGHQQWQAASAFLQRYRALPDADPMLLAYADGMLARVRGEFTQADAHFRQLLTLRPEFLPGQLELARVLFEDQQDRAAQALFQRIRARLPADDPRPLAAA